MDILRNHFKSEGSSLFYIKLLWTFIQNPLKLTFVF